MTIFLDMNQDTDEERYPFKRVHFLEDTKVKLIGEFTYKTTIFIKYFIVLLLM